MQIIFFIDTFQHFFTISQQNPLKGKNQITKFAATLAIGLFGVLK